jgi:hypothetical protein
VQVINIRESLLVLALLRRTGVGLWLVIRLLVKLVHASLGVIRVLDKTGVDLDGSTEEEGNEKVEPDQHLA